MTKLNALSFFTLPSSLEHFSSAFDSEAYPWTWLDQIGPALEGFFASTPSNISELNIPAGLHIEGLVWIDPSVKLPPYGFIKGPCWIGPDCELRPGVYIRGNVVAGADCVMGNSCEYKNSILMDHVETAHFNYVGDSILGTKAHLGAGVILANVRLDRKQISIKSDSGLVETGRRKIGAIIGEGAEISCNSVIQPGTLIGKGSYILSTPSTGGIVPERTVVRPK